VAILRHLRAALLLKPSFEHLVPFLTSGAALADLPDDLPHTAGATVHLPLRLVHKLQPKETRYTSYKTRRAV